MSFKKLFLILPTFALLLFLFSSCNSTSSANDNKQELSKLEQFKINQLAKASNTENLVLREYSIAELPFQEVGSINKSLIEQKFSFFNIQIQKNEGFDEKGAIVYYDGWKGQSIFTLLPNKENTDVKYFAVQTEAVVDEYGATVNMDYEHLIYLRPGLNLDFTEDGSPLLRANGSNIMYRMCCNVVQKESFSLEELKLLKVQNIVRQSFLDLSPLR